MGIKGLIPFLNEKVPACLSELTLESLSGEYVAVDASTALYQFSIAIRDSSYFNSLVNSNGESTSHIYGLMSRSLKLLESGIKPVFVFDSKPPDLKLKTLDKRRQKREEAKDGLKQAIAEGDVDSIKKLVGRTVKVSKEMNESAKKLLRLMGVPVIEALEEAEAQCAYLVRNNLCRFVASEDTDTLVFGGAFLLRNVTASNNKKILKVDLEKVLDGLELTFDKFVDFCILCGCDYCESLEGIGPKTAYSLVKKYDTLEDIVRLKGANYDDFKEAREYFLAPKVNEYDQGSVKMGTLDAEALTNFLVNENNFSKERVDRFIEKLTKLKTKKVQTSLLSFLSQSALSKPLKDLGKRGKGSKVTTSFRNTNKGKADSRDSNVKKQKVSVDHSSEEQENKEEKEPGERNKEDDDDEFFDKLFNLNDELDQPANDNEEEMKEVEENTNKEEQEQETREDNYNKEDEEKEEMKELETEETVEESEEVEEETVGEVKEGVKEENVEKVELEQENKEDQVKEETEKVELETEKENKKDSKEKEDKVNRENVKLELEENVELKVVSSKRVLDEDDDMTTATSENMDCDVSDVKKEEPKKGLRNLFDVLVAYPKPTKKHKN